MNTCERPVDRAMNDERPEKHYVRKLWLEEIEAVAKKCSSDDRTPWYLTLSGSEGRDIQMLIDHGLVALTEVDSIAQDDQWKVVAVECSSRAVACLQGRYPGLRIRHTEVGNLLHGYGFLTWPPGDDGQYCRARVVNLDLNSPLRAHWRDGRVVFPVPEWVHKLCMMHREPRPMDWTLLLTLHAELVWSDAPVDMYASRFMRENLRREPEFAESCNAFLGSELIGRLHEEEAVSFAELDGRDQQRLMMVLVPKLIASHVHTEGWRVVIHRNLRYGGGRTAPMVTWVVKFQWADARLATPGALYSEALTSILAGTGTVTEHGVCFENC